METKDFIQFYSQKGWDVFPCKPRDKTPLVKWSDVATTEINMLNGWLEQWPEMNLGIATGARSGIFVLDVDYGHGGEESLAALESKYGKLPNTPTTKTGGGGRHIFFKHPGFPIHNVQNSGKLGQGLDLRGDGGYVVTAPSIHPNGKVYAWDKSLAPSTTPLAPAPEWFLKLLEAPAPQKEKTQQSDYSAIPNGGRNNTLTSLAGMMRRKGMGYDAVLQALKIENQQKCIPPLSDNEVEIIASSVMRYTPALSFENRDRLQTEWAFCKSIFSFPLTIIDFINVHSSMFQDHTLADFWSAVLLGTNVTKAAIDAGILADLERYTDYDVSRLDGYARAIERFAHLAKIESFGKDVVFHAKNGDDAGIERAVNELNRIPSQSGRAVISIGDTADDVEARIRERALNPTDVWGIPYAWKRLSNLTGGKQKGELTLLSAEPKIGKSWWELQDALETAINDTPVFYWCGEMKRTQLMMRFYQLLGVNGRKMKTGQMTPDDWDLLHDAKALVMNSPLYIDDQPLMLYELRPLLARQKAEHGIEQFIIDYAMKIIAPGKDETEQTANISKEVKSICNELDLAGTLITSVNKNGFDSKSESASKGNVRGSGQQIHDADIIFIMTKFNGKDYGMDYGVMPQDYDRVISVHIAAGRELDQQIEGGFIPYMRDGFTPKFKELLFQK